MFLLVKLDCFSTTPVGDDGMEAAHNSAYLKNAPSCAWLLLGSLCATCTTVRVRCSVVLAVQSWFSWCNMHYGACAVQRSACGAELGAPWYTKTKYCAEKVHLKGADIGERVACSRRLLSGIYVMIARAADLSVSHDA